MELLTFTVAIIVFLGLFYVGLHAVSKVCFFLGNAVKKPALVITKKSIAFLKLSAVKLVQQAKQQATKRESAPSEAEPCEREVLSELSKLLETDWSQYDTPTYIRQGKLVVL